MAKRIRKATSARIGRVQVDTRQLALDIAEQMRAAAVAGPTFKALADGWLAANSARLAAPQNEWRHVRHLRALWSLSELALTPGAVRQALTALVDLGPSTRNKVRSTGRRIIQGAQEDGAWGGMNPFAVVKRAKEQRATFRTLSLEEIGLILPHLRPDRRRLTRVALLIGMRPGELLGLKKDAVALGKRAIRVHRSHHRDTTKTGREREIPIPELAVEDLARAIAESPSEYVFPRADGRRQRRDTKLARMLRTAMGKAGLVSHYNYSCRRKGCGHKERRPTCELVRCPRCDFRLWAHGVPRPARFYDLRHSAATLHRKAGADPLAVKLTMGHAVRDVGDDVYTHLTDEDVRAEMNKLKLETESTMGNPVPQAWEACALPTELPPRDLWPWVEPQPLLTVKDVAARLAVNRAMVYRLADKGELPVVRVGSLLRFRREDVDAFIGRGRA